MKFAYVEFAITNRRKLYRPALRLLLKNGKHFAYVLGVIDSGADYTILPIELAGDLGIKLDVKKKTSFVGAGKNLFTVYPSTVKLNHIIRQSGFRNLEWNAAVYFAESQPGILLGHKGFLEHFRVTLDGIKREVEILK